MNPKKFFERAATLLLAIGLVTSLAACSASSGMDSSVEVDAPSAGLMLDDLAATEESVESFEDNTLSQKDTVTEIAVIRTGYLRLRVEDPLASLNDVTQVANKLGGRIENRYVYRDSAGNLQNSELQLKIPSEKFEVAFEELTQLGHVLEDQRSDTDVTLEKTDLQARVGALQDSIARLTELMKEADSTSDLLEAEAALSSRQQELDSLQSQLTVLEDQISYSRITVSLVSDVTIPGGPANFWDGIVVGFNALMQFITVSVVVFGVALPWLSVILLLGLVLWGIIRVARKSSRSNK